MFSSQHGNQLKGNARFSDKCGNSLNKRVPIMRLKNLPLGLNKKIMVGIIIVVVLIIALAYRSIGETKLPDGVVDQFFEAVVRQEADKILELMDIETISRQKNISLDKLKEELELELPYMANVMNDAYGKGWRKKIDFEIVNETDTLATVRVSSFSEQLFHVKLCKVKDQWKILEFDGFFY